MIARLANVTSRLMFFFGNGMFNEQTIAASGLRKLSRNIFAAGDFQGDGWKFELSYNHNEGVSFILEVFRQRMVDQTASYWRWLGNL